MGERKRFAGCFCVFDEVRDVGQVVVAESVQYSLTDLIVFFEVL